MNKQMWTYVGLIAFCSCAYAQNPQKGELGTHFVFPETRIEVPDRPAVEHVTPGSNKLHSEASTSAPPASSTQPSVKPKKPGPIPVTPLLPSDDLIIMTFPRDLGPTPEELRQQQQEKLAQAERKRQREAAIADQQRRERIVDQRNEDAQYAHSEYARTYYDPNSSYSEKWDAFRRWQEAERLAAQPVD